MSVHIIIYHQSLELVPHEDHNRWHGKTLCKTYMLNITGVLFHSVLITGQPLIHVIPHNGN